MALDTLFKNQYTLIMLSTIMLSAGGCFATLTSAKNTAEPLHGITLSDHSLRFNVTSNGCMRVEHFDILIIQGDIPKLTIVRNKKDTCRRKRQAIDIDYPISLNNLGAANSFVLGNPLKPFRKQSFK
jgi:hypothetical protein